MRGRQRIERTWLWDNSKRRRRSEDNFAQVCLRSFGERRRWEGKAGWDEKVGDVAEDDRNERWEIVTKIQVSGRYFDVKSERVVKILEHQHE